MIKKEEMKAKLNNAKERVKKHGKFIAGISIGIGVMALKNWALGCPEGGRGSFSLIKIHDTGEIKAEIAEKTRIGLARKVAVSYGVDHPCYRDLLKLYENADN